MKNIIDRLIDFNIDSFFESFARNSNLREILNLAHTCKKWRNTVNVSLALEEENSLKKFL